MNFEVERRYFRRFKQMSIVKFRNGNVDHSMYGLMKNMSEGGICFESDDSMTPGACIELAVDGLPYRFGRETIKGSVRWCDVNGSTNAVHPYEMGIKFL